jgi:3-oxoacyl-[acyl-carrier-protein] synthase II
MKRVVITGIGSINALGNGVDAFASGLRAGRSAIGPLTVLPDLGFKSTLAAEIRELSLPVGLPPLVVRRASRSSTFALAAAAEALDSAGLDANRTRAAAIVLGTTTGGLSRGEENCRRLLTDVRAPVDLAGWLETPVAVPADVIAHAFGCLGARTTLSTACSSGAHALIVAADWIRCGRATTVVCGGVDSLCLLTYSGFDSLKAIDPELCRPFDRTRAGLNLGEGAAIFVFEDLESALARGARPLAEFVSGGMSADAHHPTQPRPDGAGAIQAMRAALAEGGVAPEEIDYVNAHGTGTPHNDAVETRAIKAVLGEHARKIPVSSTKSMIGHCLGAAGALEALACVLAVRDGFVPPTVNLREPDPECDLDYVPGAARPAWLRTILSNSYGFGGNNAAVILRAPDNELRTDR